VTGQGGPDLVGVGVEGRRHLVKGNPNWSSDLMLA
jgi:hypothetical protein